MRGPLNSSSQSPVPLLQVAEDLYVSFILIYKNFYSNAATLHHLLRTFSTFLDDFRT